ncbi:MAG TPA: LPS export ABC transporter periplasmic protein LptC, partial [Candidatus Brocadiaceae bacterium]|nr:LPS export ABC transporter periplasmic protein LptC [Candidatus Brocadiaceae bacterium]
KLIMPIRRYVLLTIPLACLIIIFVSLIVYRPTENKESQSQKQKETQAPAKKSQERTKNSDTIRQSVEELSMPSYDEKGKEILVLRGENTILLNDNVYKIIAPEIEVMDSTDTENGTQTILITSDKGEMNNVSREGYLSDNVVVHFDVDTKLNTDYLRYLPNKNQVYTDNPVTILGNGTKIIGEGCEIDLINKKMWIKKDVVMEMGGMKNDPFFMPDKSPKQEAETSSEDTVPAEAADAKEAKEAKTEKTVIRSSGQLVFEKQVDAQILTFNDQVVMKIGATTVFSDKLIIYIDPVTKQAKQSIAIGSVLASQEGKIAKGNMLTWDVNTQSATLEDDRQAEFVQEGMNLYAEKMIFYKNIGRIDVPAAGTLQVEPKKKGKTAGNAEESDVDVINIAWEGSMAYVSDAREATFEKDVAVIRENSILSCNHLKVKLSDHDDNIMSLKGWEDVHIINQKEGGLVSEAVGDQVIWNVKNKISVLRGDPFVILKDGEDRQIFSPKVVFYEGGHNMLCEGEGSLYEKADKLHSQDEAENEDLKVKWLKKMFYNAELRKASFYEGVEATRGGERLDSDQMDAYFDGNQKMTKLIAAGNVYFLSKNLDGNEGLGSFLTWDFIQNTALLTGKPKAELRKGGSRTFSEEVYFNMAKNQITWEGSPHWQVIDKQQSDR